MTPDELRVRRAAAGAAYVSAVDTLRIAWIELAACDAATRNRAAGTECYAASFTDDVVTLVRATTHAEFRSWPTVLAEGNWRIEANNRAAEIVANLN